MGEKVKPEQRYPPKASHSPTPALLFRFRPPSSTSSKGGSNAIPRAHYPKSPLGDLAARQGDGGAVRLWPFFSMTSWAVDGCVNYQRKKWDRDRAYMGRIRFVLCPSGVVIVLEDDGVENLELRGMY